MKSGRVVVRIEISTLSDANGKLNHQKMDRLAMVLSDLNNSGKQLLLVSSGAIALGTDRLCLNLDPKDISGMMASAAVGQAELIKNYQRYFEAYNQMVSQVLLTSDIMAHQQRMENAKSTFNTLLEMNIIPIINENDAVSTSDIELEDNYALAYNVARIAEADVILIKSDINSKYIIQPRNGLNARVVEDEQELFRMLDNVCIKLNTDKESKYNFPKTIGDIVFEKSEA